MRYLLSQKALAGSCFFTLTMFFLDMFRDKKERPHIYTAFFIACYLILSVCSNLQASETNEDIFIGHKAVETGMGIIFEHDPDYMPTVEEYIRLTEITKQGYSREQLIAKMMFHKKKYDHHLLESEKIVKEYKMWDSDIENFYKACKAGVCTYVGGGRNYLLPALVALIDFTFEEGWSYYNMWCEYSSVINNCKYHAEMFDFYMGVLLKLHGN